MPAETIQLADAIVTLLQTRAWGVTLNARRVYLPRMLAKDMSPDVVEAQVRAVSFAHIPGSRSHAERDLTVEVALLRKVALDAEGMPSQTQVDYALELAEDVLNALRTDLGPEYRFVEGSVQQAPRPDHLAESGVATLVIAATWRVLL
jgi:hypothetical protein